MQAIEVRVKGQIDGDWSDWLGGLAIVHTARGDTEISGVVRDQAALFGLLHLISGLGLQMVSLTCKETKASHKQGGVVNMMTGG